MADASLSPAYLLRTDARLPPSSPLQLDPDLDPIAAAVRIWHSSPGQCGLDPLKIPAAEACSDVLPEASVQLSHQRLSSR